MNQKRHHITVEMLSAYLDNQLSEKDRSKVESALQIDETLKQDLIKLDATRRLLHNAPVIKVPRNFTLSSAMVSKQNPFKFWMPAMSFSSALAAVLFVLTFVFNINTLGTSLTAQTRSMNQFTASDSIAAESMEMADESAKSSAEETPMIIQWFGQQANGMGGGGPGDGIAEGEIMAAEAAPMAAESPAYEMETESEQSAMDTASEPTADAAVGVMPAEQPSAAMEEALPMTKDAPEIEINPNITGEAQSNLILGISPEENRGQIIQDQADSMQPMQYENTQTNTQRPIVLAVLRAGLLLLAFLFASIAWLMHQRRAKNS